MRPFLEVKVRAKALREAGAEGVLRGLVQAGRVLLEAYGPGSVLYEVAELFLIHISEPTRPY